MMFVNILQVRLVAAPNTVTWLLALSGHGIVVAFNSNHYTSVDLLLCYLGIKAHYFKPIHHWSTVPVHCISNCNLHYCIVGFIYLALAHINDVSHKPL